MKNLPLQLDQETTLLIQRHAEVALGEGLRSALFAHGDTADPGNLHKEYALAAHRWAMNALGNLECEDLLGDAPLAVGTTPGTEPVP